MKFEVIYLKPKKNTYAKHTATFLELEGAIFWENHIKTQGCKDIKICPK
jgi:hypothetical protein